jgi:branched-chain amino acid transport system permease protein
LPSFTLLGQSLLSGLFIGVLYGLLGIGLSLSWGLLRQINLSHFALAFLGAYLTYQLGGATAGHAAGMDPLATLLIIIPGFFLFGVLLHWVLVRFSISPFNSLLVTFGLTVILESLIQWIWTADYRRLESSYGEVKFKLGEIFISLPDVITFVISIGLAIAIWAVLRFTDLGKAMRAVAEDAPIAVAFGINERLLGLLLSGASAALAGIAGMCLALSFTLAPSQIYTWVGVVFAVVMIGGLANPVGAMIAGAAIGIAEAITMALIAPAWAPLVSFSLMMAVLLFRPDKV